MLFPSPSLVPDVLGIRTQDPMMVSLGLDPLLLTEAESWKLKVVSAQAAVP